jgi:hypothetical protein
MSNRYLIVYFLLLAACSNGQSVDREKSIELTKKGIEYYYRATSVGFMVENPPVKKEEMIDSTLFCLSEAIRLDSTNKTAYRQKMIFENSFDKYDDARATATLFHKKFSDPYALLLLAGIVDRTGDTLQSKMYRREALRYYTDKIAAKTVTEDSILFDLTTMYYYNNQLENARAYYDRYRKTKRGQMTFKDVEFDSLVKIL